jgi:hypothetical protein
MFSSSRKIRHRPENTASESLGTNSAYLLQKTRAGADRLLQSWLYLHAVATSVVASHEQDYDAFAAIALPVNWLSCAGEEACYTEGIRSSGMGLGK